jgi:hypothetical protein
MPKSRRHRGKYALVSKKKKGRRGPQVVTLQQREPAPVEKPVAVPAKVAHVPSAPVPAVTVINPDLPLELRRIGILTGIMLVVLVLLALFWR